MRHPPDRTALWRPPCLLHNDDSIEHPLIAKNDAGSASVQSLLVIYVSTQSLYNHPSLRSESPALDEHELNVHLIP